MSDRYFKCGACGTEGRGFRSDMMLAAFQDDHATICPGFGATSELRAALEDATAFRTSAALNRARVLLGQEPIPSARSGGSAGEEQR